MRRFFRRKWLVRFTLAALVLLSLGPLLAREFVKWRGATRLAQVVRQLDETDPGWRLDALAAEHNARLSPPERNSFTLVEQAHAALPEEWDKRVPLTLLAENRPANQLLPDDDLAPLAALVADIKPAVAVARQLADRPDGGRRIEFPPVPFAVDLTGPARCGSVSTALALDSIMAAHNGNAADAIRDVRACVSAARAIGDEPIILSQLYRSGIANRAADATTRVLSLCRPTDGLAELQAELLREADAPRLTTGLRGGRAASFRMLELFAAGEVAMRQLDTLPTKHTPEWWEGAAVWFLRAYAADNNADLTERYNSLLAGAARPPAERWAAFPVVARPFFSDIRDAFARLMSVEPEMFPAACFRTRAKLRTAAAVVACERFHQRFGKWPTKWEDVPREILPAVPIDPFTGAPLLLRQTPEGLIVYSAGYDAIDGQGRQLSDDRHHIQGKDLGYRLWNPDQRRQPAPPRDDAPAPANP